MISVSYDHGGAVTGVVINETTYSPAAILALAQEVERLRAIEAAARDVVARASHVGMGIVALNSADLDGLIIALEAFTRRDQVGAAVGAATGAVVDAAIALRACQRVLGSAAPDPRDYQWRARALTAHLVAERALYAAVDALTAAQEGQQ